MLDLDTFLIPGTLRPLSQRFLLRFIRLTDQSSTKIHPICRALFQLHHYLFLSDPCETSPTACSVAQTQTPVPFRDFTRDPPRNFHLHTCSLKGSIALADQKLKNDLSRRFLSILVCLEEPLKSLCRAWYEGSC